MSEILDLTRAMIGLEVAIQKMTEELERLSEAIDEVSKSHTQSEIEGASDDG